MKTPALTRTRQDHIPSLRGVNDVRFARGSSPPATQAPERPTCPLDVSELIRLLDVDTDDVEVRDTRRVEAHELRTLGVIEGGELPSMAWATAPRLADLDDRLAPTMIVELADPPARPLHHANPIEDESEDDEADYSALVLSGLELNDVAEPEDDLADIELTFELGANAVAPKASMKGFVVGLAVGLASVAAAFTALGVLGH